MSTILEFENVVRSFNRGTPVLDGVSFSVKAGEVVGLVGSNGAGKTTAINIAMGMLFPNRGSVRLFGMSPMENPVEVKRRIGYVSENQLLPASATIADAYDYEVSLSGTLEQSPQAKEARKRRYYETYALLIAALDLYQSAANRYGIK